VNGLHPITVVALRTFRLEASRSGLSFHVTSGFRSLSRQRSLYARWLRGDPRVIAPALPGRSTHNYGLAFDVVSDDQVALLALGRSIGLETIAGDPVHFQVVSKADWQALLQYPPATIAAIVRNVR